MNGRMILISGLVALSALTLAACQSAPTPTVLPTVAPSPSVVPSTATSAGSASSEYETKSSDGGNVALDVKPIALGPGVPVSFDIAMNTHSVNLNDDMVKASVLRDDSGKEYRPTAWDGDGAGGHHRSGTLKFGTLSGRPKYVELVIKGVAQVPERVFRWEIAQ